MLRGPSPVFRLASFAVCAAALVSMLAVADAYGGNRCNVAAVQVQSFALQSGLVVTPFAVPVAAPVGVAQVNPYVYGFSSGASGYSTQSYSASAASSAEDRIADKVIAKLKAAGFGGSTLQAQALPEKPSLVKANCAKCHSGTAKQGGFSIDGMTPEGKLKAVARVLADNPKERMPKGKTLDPQTLGLLLQELAGGNPVPAPPAPAEPLPEAPKE